MVKRRRAQLCIGGRCCWPVLPTGHTGIANARAAGGRSIARKLFKWREESARTGIDKGQRPINANPACVHVARVAGALSAAIKAVATSLAALAALTAAQ